MTAYDSQTAGFLGSGASFHRQRFVVHTYPYTTIVTNNTNATVRVSGDGAAVHGRLNQYNPNPYIGSGGSGGGVQPNLRQMLPAYGYPPHSPTSLKSEGVRAGEIIAYRAWLTNLNYKDNPRLCSSYVMDKIWVPDTPMEGDVAGGYGVHAYKDIHGVIDSGWAGPGFANWVLGTVYLWGDVIEHERGYRAQYGRVKELIMACNSLRSNFPGAFEILKAKYEPRPKQPPME